jgi:acyl-CoA thioesterase FadM
MYPYVRMAKEVLKFRNAPALGLLGTHVSHHVCWPWDIDPWLELNNGRVLTLYDLGRIPLASRTGLVRVTRANGWGLTVAGNSVRYRRRVQTFQRFEMQSRCIGWDARFFYVEQSMWRRGECTNQMLLRMAVIAAGGMIAPGRVAAELGHAGATPALPDWVQAWIAADATRPWPPQP